MQTSTLLIGKGSFHEPGNSPFRFGPDVPQSPENLAPGDPVFRQRTLPRLRIGRAVFRKIAAPYRLRANIYMLNTRESPRHPLVTATPTVLFYKHGRLVKKLLGIGTEETLAAEFVRHIGRARLPAVPRKPRHDLHWLRQALRNLCTVARARR